jgi:hypothetical protein
VAAAKNRQLEELKLREQNEVKVNKWTDFRERRCKIIDRYIKLRKQ